MSFTASQQEAVFCRGGSVLVSAGAGSGKTRVLTERLLSYLDPPPESGAEPAGLDRFLIITFTNAAAGELRARIADAIAERLRKDPANAHLRRQMALCRNAEIGTIHAFCKRVLRDHAPQLHLPVPFRILEEERSEQMREKALERILDRQYEEGAEPFLRLADSVGAGRDDSRLADLLLKLHRTVQSHARPSEWIQAQIASFDAVPDDPAQTDWGRELLEDTSEAAAFWHGEMEAALLKMQGADKIRKCYGESFAATADALDRLDKAAEQGWDAVRACLPVPFPRISGIKNNPDPALSEQMKTMRAACKKAMEGLAEVFRPDAESACSQLRDTAPDMQMLLRLVLELEEEFTAAKRKAKALDFSDLEHLTLQLLCSAAGERTPAAEEISARYTEVMVDEYQDVSRVQDQIFHAVSREGENLFFVGDLKQAIYRFRLADPGIFTEKSARYGKTENDRGERLIRLQENFRSRKEILDAVNCVFRKCMSERLGDLDYGPADELVLGADYPDSVPVPELLLLGKEEETDAAETEARFVAAEIRRLIGKVRIRGREGERELRYGDIAILLRTANTLGGTFRRCLLAEGIPVSSGNGGDFYESTEVSTVYSMLSLIDNPHRDIPLLTVLQSASVGLSADSLGQIRAQKPDADFYTALCSSEDPDARRFLEKLQRLRTAAPDRNPSELIHLIAEELDLYALCSAMPDGERRLQRLQDLSDLAETFRKGEEYGVHHFLRWFERMQKKGQEPAGAAGGGNAVQILSIHRSKGLEFPVVFYSGLGHSFNKADLRETVLIHPELGLGPKRTESGRKVEYPTAARRAVARRILRETLSEEMRLMYVAMTRAKERLILTACISKPDEQLERAEHLRGYEKIPAPLLTDASCPLQWLLPAAMDGRGLLWRCCYAEETGEERETPPEPEFTAEDGDTLKKLERNLTWTYPRSAAETLPSKLTVTELKARSGKDEDALPVFSGPREKKLFSELRLDRKPLAAAARGTAFHVCLQQIDFDRTQTAEDISAELDRMVGQAFLSAEERAAVSPEVLLQFFRSSLGERIRRAERCWREFRFSLLTDLKPLLPGAPEGEQALLQGVVDCCIEENGALTVVDYKTDRVEEEPEIRARAEYYRTQLDLYAQALQRIFGMPVREKILYFLHSGREWRL